MLTFQKKLTTDRNNLGDYTGDFRTGLGISREADATRWFTAHPGISQFGRINSDHSEYSSGGEGLSP